MCLRMNHSQYHCENIDEVRKTNTTLGVLLESRINDYWNADGDRNLTQFTIFNEEPPDGYM